MTLMQQILSHKEAMIFCPMMKPRKTEITEKLRKEINKVINLLPDINFLFSGNV
jgi:hypothetical protein